MIISIYFKKKKMSLSTVIYHTDSCYKTEIIDLINKFANQKLEKINISNLSKENQEKVAAKSITGHLPLLQKGDFFLSETKAIIMFLLNETEVSGILLKSNNIFEKSHVEMWIDFTKSTIWVLLEALFESINGKISKNPDINIYKEAELEIKNVLLKINSHLIYKTYIVGDSLSLADLFLAVSLKNIFATVLSKDDLKLLNYLTRWFKLISSAKEFKELFGEIILP